jgi:hypothetical protein
MKSDKVYESGGVEQGNLLSKAPEIRHRLLAELAE